MSWKDFDWIRSHYEEILKQYPDMYLVVKDGHVVAWNKDFGKTYDKAKSILGSEDFAIYYMHTCGLLETNL